MIELLRNIKRNIECYWRRRRTRQIVKRADAIVNKLTWQAMKATKTANDLSEMSENS